MNAFDPASLSPMPKGAIACDLPYGLTWENLQPILAGFHQQYLERAQAFASHEKQGLNGGDNSCILTLSYPINEFQNRKETVFIKHTEDPLKAEAHKYQFLASHGVPVPRLLGAVHIGDAETLILEFLATIGIDFSSPLEVNSMLDLAARINSIQEPPDPNRKRPAGLPQAQFDEMVRSALIEIERTTAQTTTPNQKIDAARWFNAYQAAQKAVHSMPMALNHNQFYFQQVGWAQRGLARQLVVFDLETLYLSPRFTDIAGIIFPLSIYSRREQLELFQFYLERMKRLNHQNFYFDDALREFRYTRIWYLCESLPWLVSELKRPGAVDLLEIRPLWDDLSNLGLV